tara:strand:- start:448 stop:795 length:348 start_codon:yes stop_codon:yes gene_type:complete
MDNHKIHIRNTEFKNMLLSELQDITNISLKTVKDRAPVELDQQAIGRLSRMDAMQQQSMDTAKEARRIGRLRLIEAALRRLEEGDYGYCLNCDESISDGRLKLDPTFSLCIDCAK